MSDDNGMAVPSWVDSMRDTMLEAVESKPKIKVLEKEPVEHLASHFAEFETKGNDVIVHLFPRRDMSDRWYPSSLKEDGTYIPSRREAITDLRFPYDIEEKIEAAVDVVWQGDVAIEKVTILAIDPGEDVEFAKPYEHETGAYVVQFQNATSAAQTLGLSTFVTQFCEELDKQME